MTDERQNMLGYDITLAILRRETEDGFADLFRPHVQLLQAFHKVHPREARFNVREELGLWPVSRSDVKD